MAILCQGYDISKSASIICKHAARQGLAILSAQRDEPIDAVDTGWQFTCDVNDHEPADGEVWCVASVIELDPTIADVIDNPTRSVFKRSGAGAPWVEVEYQAVE